MLATLAPRTKTDWTPERWHDYAARYRGLLCRINDLVRDLPVTRGLMARDINLLIRVHDQLANLTWLIEDVYDRQTWGSWLEIPGSPYLSSRINDGVLWMPCRGRLPKRVGELTRAEWVELGRTAKGIGRSIVALALELGTTKGVPIKLVERLVSIEEKAFAKFKSRMDDLVCRQHPDWPDAISVFYGTDEPTL